jgi:hypothetical protein
MFLLVIREFVGDYTGETLLIAGGIRQACFNFRTGVRMKL